MSKHFVIVFVLGMFLFTGCATIFTPNNVGYISGKATYIAYTEIANRYGKNFTSKVNQIWSQINQIKSIEEVKKFKSDFESKFDSVISDNNISEVDKKKLVAIKNEIFKKLDQVFDKTFSADSDALEYLIGFRDGVNSMIF